MPIIIVDIDDKRPEDTISFLELIQNDVDLSILNNVRRDGNDVALLPFSSGTTGLPKGVQLSNINALSSWEQQNTELRQYEYTSGKLKFSPV